MSRRKEQQKQYEYMVYVRERIGIQVLTELRVEGLQGEGHELQEYK